MNTHENTPKHCWGCHKFTECEQAQYMVADTQPVDAYMGDAELLCGACSYAREFIGHSGDTDSPDHCAVCGIPLRCSLTSDGVEYVKEAIAEGAGCCRELWPVLFADYLS